LSQVFRPYKGTMVLCDAWKSDKKRLVSKSVDLYSAIIVRTSNALALSVAVVTNRRSAATVRMLSLL